jgi:hypothetical protein
MPGGPIETVNIPGLAKVVQLLYEQLAGGQDARALQAANAPQIVAEVQGTLTDAASVYIAKARQRTQYFSFCVIIFDQTAGKGRYSYIGGETKGGLGFPIGSGGGSLVLAGAQDIASFGMIAETGETLPYTYGLWL